MSSKKVISPSRYYVAICNKTGFNGHYFRHFILPAGYNNNAETAGWYFLNYLNFEACLELCVTFEDFCNIKEQK